MTYKQMLKLEKILTLDIKIFERLHGVGVDRTKYDSTFKLEEMTEIDKLIHERRIILQEIKDVLATYSNQDINALKVMERDGKKGYHKALKPSTGKPWV